MKKQLFISLFILAFIFSCKPKANMIYMSNHNFEQDINEARYTGLRIKEGDVLEIKVSAFDEIAVKPFNLPTISTTNAVAENGAISSQAVSQYVVDTEGSIDFPVLGIVYCKGMTKQQLKKDLENRLLAYLTDPIVTIKLVNFNVSVLGEVKSPGLKSSPTEKLSVFQALALAGDMADSGDRTKVKLLRYLEEKNKDTLINLDFSSADIVNSPYYYLQQNDILYVEPDKNKQIAANNTNPNKALFFQVLSAALAISLFFVRYVK